MEDCNLNSSKGISDDQKFDWPANFVIVIGRQFGSGGRTVGKLIAKRLGISYYDTELLSQAAKSLGINPQVFKEMDEKRPSVLKSILQGAYGIADNFHTVPIAGERIYSAQCNVIRDLSKKGSCVIVGRNADFILRGHPGLLSVFLHSPVENRVKRIKKRGDAISEEEALEMAQKHDRRRESFYNYYTGDKKWGVADNYHLCLDTSLLDNETVADIIITVAKNKFRNIDKK